LTPLTEEGKFLKLRTSKKNGWRAADLEKKTVFF
jgi:hypothetical protein